MTTVLVTRPSVSSRQLARRLPNTRRILVGTRSVPRADLVINWGCSEIPELRRGINLLNSELAVRNTVDKKTTLQILSHSLVPTVDFTEDSRIAESWHREGQTVYGRELTRSSGGEGIKLFLAKNQLKRGEVFPKYPLFTKFWKCDSELRVHVFRDKVIDFSEKRRRRVANPPENRYWIRTYNNGWIFARENAVLHPKVGEVACRAVRALGLDFGAVDVLAKKNGEARVLEVNSAPGIERTTLTAYVNAFRRIILGLA